MFPVVDKVDRGEHLQTHIYSPHAFILWGCHYKCFYYSGSLVSNTNLQQQHHVATVPKRTQGGLVRQCEHV